MKRASITLALLLALLQLAACSHPPTQGSLALQAHSASLGGDPGRPDEVSRIRRPDGPRLSVREELAGLEVELKSKSASRDWVCRCKRLQKGSETDSTC